MRLKLVITSVRDNRILAEKSEGKKSLGKSRRRWDGNIKMHIKWMCCDVDRIKLTQEMNQW
jgi:hypothetical protein